VGGLQQPDSSVDPARGNRVHQRPGQVMLLELGEPIRDEQLDAFLAETRAGYSPV
jgi:hypothetical protein